MLRGPRGGPKIERGRRQLNSLMQPNCARPLRACMHLCTLAAGGDATHALTKACFARHRTN